jgi:hypothetical protein
MVVWSIRNVLTRGIVKEEGCEWYRSDRDGVKYAKRTNPHLFEQLGKDCFDTEKEARTRALEVCERKLVSLDKQIDKVCRVRESLAAGGNGKPARKRAAK